MIFQGIIRRLDRNKAKAVVTLTDKNGNVSQGAFYMNTLQEHGIHTEVGEPFMYEKVERLWPKSWPWWKRLAQKLRGRLGAI